MINILIADDHGVVRQGLKAILATEPSFQVVGEASNGQDTLMLVEKHKPDILILDLMMPDINGLEVTRLLTESNSETQVLILSMHNDEAYVLKALNNGARGYVLKDASAAVLVEAIKEVAEGRRYLCSPLSDKAIESYIEKATGDIGSTVLHGLTARETEVLTLLIEGCSNSDIAERLKISPRTSEVHRSRIMKKLGVRNQASLVKLAVQKGLLQIEGS